MIVSREERAVPVLYLDLDGTVRQGKDDALGRFVNGPEDVVIFPEAVTMMRRWKQGGGRAIGVSNQGGVSLGIVPYDRVAAAMRETTRQAPARRAGRLAAGEESRGMEWHASTMHATAWGPARGRPAVLSLT